MCTRPYRYAVLSFAIADLAEGSALLSVITNGLVLPLIAATIRTSALPVLLPLFQETTARTASFAASVITFSILASNCDARRRGRGC